MRLPPACASSFHWSWWLDLVEGMAFSDPSRRGQDWVDFQAVELQNAIERALLILRSKCMQALCVCGFLSDMALPGNSWREVILSPRLLVYLLAVIAHVGGPRLRRLTHAHPLQIGCLVQIAITLLLFSSSVLLSIRSKSELVQHRVFLTAHMVHMVLLQCVTYFPFWFHVCVVTPCCTLTWFSFHAMVEFRGIPMVIFGVFYNVVLPLFIANLMEKLKWQEFQANRQLASERKILEDTQSTLHSMLSSQWDASCTCQENGRLLSSTPHLEQLLGGGQDLIGCDLCSFAADDADACRLTVFLQSIASSEERQALTLQCTVSPKPLSCDPGLSTQLLEVSFYGIKLPQGARFQSSSFDQDGPSLFIGVKAGVRESESGVMLADANAAALDFADDAAALDVALDDLCVDAASDKSEDNEDEDSTSDGENVRDADVISSAHVGSCAAASSIAGTTLTGRVFGQIANVGRHATDCKKHLEAIAKIGAKEHWLVSTSHIQLLPEAVLGLGGFGIVILGLVHGAHVALKLPRLANDVYTGQALRTLVNELRILRHIRHPNCVSLYGACIDAQNYFVALVFEFVQGKTLQAIVGSTESPITTSGRLSLILDICCALRYLHALSPQIVHGDLKPSNVLVEEWVQGLRAKVLDFGLSCLMTPNRKGLGGTVAYMAPEALLRTYGAQGASADVFSFGRLARFIVSGLPPFPKVRAQEIRAMAQRGFFEPVEWPDEPLCKECEALCTETSSFDANARPSISSVHDTILAWAVPDGPRRPMHDGAHCNPVEWLDGIKSVRAKCGVEQEVYAFIDLLDQDFQLTAPSFGWISFFGASPAGTRKCLLKDYVQLMDQDDSWASLLQAWANCALNEDDGINLETTVKLAKAYCQHSCGQMYKAVVSVSSPSSHSSDCDTNQIVVKLQLGNLRRAKRVGPAEMDAQAKPPAPDAVEDKLDKEEEQAQAGGKLEEVKEGIPKK